MSKRRCSILLSFLIAAIAGATAWSAGSPVTITFWGWQYTVDCLKDNLDDFHKAYPEIKVNLKVLAPQDLYRRLPAAATSGGSGPDVVAVENSHLAQVMATGGLLDITGLVGPYKQSFNAFKWEDCSLGSHILAMPWDSGPVALWYRRDVIEKAGFKPDPEAVATLFDTWDDLYRAAKTIKEQTGAYVFAFAGNQNDGRILEILLQQRSLGYFDSRGKVTLDSPEAVKTLEFMGQLYKEGLIQDSVPWTDPWYAGIRDGSVAAILGTAWMGGFIRDWIAPETAGKWGVVALPLWIKGKGVRTSNDGGSSLAILKQSKKTDAAWSFVQFMLARKESQLNMLKKRDSFPALAETYADPYFDDPDPFFGGQACRRVFATLAPQIPTWYYTENYSMANSLCSAEIQVFLMGKQDARTALVKAAANIRAKIKNK